MRAPFQFNRKLSRTEIVLLLVGAAVLFPILAVEVMTKINSDNAVIQVSYYKPTETKAQSKLWYAHGSWWAWLPHRNGSVVWRRRNGKWEQLNHLNSKLRQTGGVADVFQDKSGVGAVIAGPHNISFAKLAFDTNEDTYQLDGNISHWEIGSPRIRHKVPFFAKGLSSMPGDFFREIESAVIVKGPAGTWWITYDIDKQIMLMRSKTEDGTDWYPPELVATVENPDELSSIYTERNGISVVWSDQYKDSIFLTHYASDAPRPYYAPNPRQVIDSGEKTADDHINVAQSDNGTIWIASKSDRDVLSRPELTLRKKALGKGWRNFNYEPLTGKHLPSRPIVMSIQGSSDILLLHTMRERNGRKSNHIRLGRMGDQDNPKLVKFKQLAPEIFDQGNLTGPKAPLPENAEWITLSSDRFGNIFEWVLSEAE